MRKQNIAYINKKIAELSQLIKMKTTPKMRVSKKVLLAGAFLATNEFHISERLLTEWEEGIIDRNEVDVILAHEFGHFIAYNQKSRLGKFKRLFMFPSYMILLIVAGFGLIFSLSQDILIHTLVLMIDIVFFAVWIFFFPSVVRHAYLFDELEANRTAIEYNLVTPQQLANSLVNRIGLRPDKSVGANEILNILWDILTHPFISEQLRDIGFEIKRPIQTQRVHNQN